MILNWITVYWSTIYQKVDMEDVTDDEESNKEKEKKNDEDPVFVKVVNFIFSCVVKCLIVNHLTLNWNYLT